MIGIYCPPCQPNQFRDRDQDKECKCVNRSDVYKKLEKECDQNNIESCFLRWYHAQECDDLLCLLRRKKHAQSYQTQVEIEQWENKFLTKSAKICESGIQTACITIWRFLDLASQNRQINEKYIQENSNFRSAIQSACKRVKSRQFEIFCDDNVDYIQAYLDKTKQETTAEFNKALTEGSIRLANYADLENLIKLSKEEKEKKIKYNTKFFGFNEYSLNNLKYFDSQSQTYVVLKKFTYPDKLYGALSVNFIVDKSTPEPTGNPGHSRVYNLNKSPILQKPFAPVDSLIQEKDILDCKFENLKIPSETLVVAAVAKGVSQNTRTTTLNPTNDFVNKDKSLIDVTVNFKKPVALILSTYEKSIWKINTTNNTKIVAVFISGYHDQAIEGLPNEIPVHISTHEHQTSCKYFILSQETGIEDANMLSRKLFGKTVDYAYNGKNGYVLLENPLDVK